MFVNEVVTALAYQGLANRGPQSEGIPALWLGGDNFALPNQHVWHAELASSGRVAWDDVEPTLCGLLGSGAAPAGRVAGLVAYNETGGVGDGYSMAFALTLAGQRGLLPVTTRALGRHACLRSMAVKVDLRKPQPFGTDRDAAWRWAIDTLLPRSSTTFVTNMDRYRAPAAANGNAAQAPVAGRSSTATAIVPPFADNVMATVDYAVAQNMFVLDLEPHCGPVQRKHSRCTSHAWTNDDELIMEVFSKLDPMFSAFGWGASEFAWTNETSTSGGTVFCAGAAPNLSVWARLPCDAGGRRVARALPRHDRGMAYDPRTKYAAFMTNEGDTPWVLAQLFSGAWLDPARGTVPIAWSIDPILAEMFPALFDFFAGSARANDSFVAGVAGAGYVFLNQLDDAQLARYTRRVGRLINKYGPNVVDTYGYVTREIFPKYAANAAKGGVAPTMFTSQDQRPTPPIDTFYPDPRNFWLDDGTPVVSSNTSLFYFDQDDGGLDPACPSCDFANRIRAVAAEGAGNQFVLTYGGLGSAADPFFELMRNTTASLERDGAFVVVGAQEMARLARDAHAYHAAAAEKAEKAAAKEAKAKAATTTTPQQLNNYSIAFQTDVPAGSPQGLIVINVTAALAPLGAAHLRKLLEAKFYDEAAFFRVVPDFVVQFGIAGTPAENAKWTTPIQDDPVVASNVAGSLTYATAGPNTRTTQLFVNLKDNARLDAMGFAPFGTVVAGMDVLRAIFNPTPGNSGGVDQNAYTSKGNAWIKQQYPGIQFITSGRVEEA